MKPDWDKAPEWAMYCAKDQNGTWWWYSQMPMVVGPRNWDGGEGYVEMADTVDWRQSLQERPK